MQNSEKKSISYKKTARDLKKVSLDAIEVLFVNFTLFYYLIYEASKVDEQAGSNLKKGLKYAFEALYNPHAFKFALVGGLSTFLIACYLRPKNPVVTNYCHKGAFGFCRRLSRSLLSLAITLSMFKFIALTHGQFVQKADLIDAIFFMLVIYSYILIIFNLSYNDKASAKENTDNLLQALKIIFITILSVALLGLFMFMELNYHCFSQLWN